MNPGVGLGLLSPVLLAACVDGSFPIEFDPKPTRRVDPSVRYYGPAEPALKKLLVSKRKDDATNHFCVVGYEYSATETDVWVHWVEEQRLLLWRDNSDPELREKGLVSAKSNLKLDKDTVQTPDEINGSSYLVTRAWWKAVAVDCSQHGRRYTVEPFKADG